MNDLIRLSELVSSQPKRFCCQNWVLARGTVNVGMAPARGILILINYSPLLSTSLVPETHFHCERSANMILISQTGSWDCEVNWPNSHRRDQIKTPTHLCLTQNSVDLTSTHCSLLERKFITGERTREWLLTPVCWFSFRKPYHSHSTSGHFWGNQMVLRDIPKSKIQKNTSKWTSIQVRKSPEHLLSFSLFLSLVLTTRGFHSPISSPVPSLQLFPNMPFCCFLGV